MLGLLSQCFHSLHELLNEKRRGLIPELLWNSCVKKPKGLQTIVNFLQMLLFSSLSQHMVMQRISKGYSQLIRFGQRKKDTSEFFAVLQYCARELAKKCSDWKEKKIKSLY